MSRPHARLERLDDYVTGALADDEASAFEEELFSAVGADARAEADVHFFDRLHRGVTKLVRLGGLAGPSTEEDVERLRAAGMKLHVVDVAAHGGSVEIPPWPADVDVVVFRTHVDARGYEDVEVDVENPDGTPVKTFRGVECDPATGNLYAICAPPLAKMAYGARRRITRVTGVRAGERETIAVFDTSPRL